MPRQGEREEERGNQDGQKQKSKSVKIEGKKGQKKLKDGDEEESKRRRMMKEECGVIIEVRPGKMAIKWRFEGKII